MLYLWLKSLHLITMVAWFAGLFYLPRLFVYHTQVTSNEEYARFCIMERKLYAAIMTPAAIFTLTCGALMVGLLGLDTFRHMGWLHTKLSLILTLCIYHGFCRYYKIQFTQRNNQKSERFFRIFNEIPAVLLIGIILLAVLKP
jgi:putative membrane protein